MDFKTIIYEKKDRTEVVTLNRPGQMNALSQEMIREITEVMDNIEADPGVRVVVIAGSEKAFSVGADLKERARMNEEMDSRGATPLERTEHLKNSRRMFLRIENLPKPTIACMSGYALGGGCELALVCDLRVASDSLKIGLTEVRIGAIPAGGGTQRLFRLIGMSKARELLLTGEPVDALTALGMGLVNRVVPRDKLMKETLKLAGLLSQRAPLALKMIKLALRRGMEMDLDSGLDLEYQLATLLSTTSDLREGRKAFLEKRPPDFKGR